MSVDKIEEIELHLKSCSPCSQMVEEVRRIYLLLDQERQVKVNPFLYTRVKARSKLSSKTLILDQFMTYLIKPVIVAIAIFLGILFGQFNVSQTTDSEDEVEMLSENLLPPDYQESIIAYESDQ